MGKDHSKNRNYYYLTLLYINGNYYIIFKDANEKAQPTAEKQSSIKCKYS